MYYYSLNIGDFALWTTGFDSESVGIFVQLLNRHLSTEKPIKTQWVYLGYRKDEQEKALAILSTLWEETPDGWIFPPVVEIIQKYQQNASKNRANGQKGGRPRKNPNETQTKPSGFFTETQTEPNHNPNETLTNNQITNNQITNNREKKEVQEKTTSRKSDDFRDPLVEKIVSVYRETTTGYFSQIQALPDKRKRAVKKFIDFYRKQVNAVDEAAFLSAVREYFCRAVRSPFLTGQNERGWRADFDFLMNENKALALLEGKYDGHAQVSVSKPNIFTVPSSRRSMQIAQAENYEPDFDLGSFGVAK